MKRKLFLVLTFLVLLAACQSSTPKPKVVYEDLKLVHTLEPPDENNTIYMETKLTNTTDYPIKDFHMMFEIDGVNGTLSVPGTISPGETSAILNNSAHLNTDFENIKVNMLMYKVLDGYTYQDITASPQDEEAKNDVELEYTVHEKLPSAIEEEKLNTFEVDQRDEYHAAIQEDIDAESYSEPLISIDDIDVEFTQIEYSSLLRGSITNNSSETIDRIVVRYKNKNTNEYANLMVYEQIKPGMKSEETIMLGTNPSDIDALEPLILTTIINPGDEEQLFQYDYVSQFTILSDSNNEAGNSVLSFP